MPTYEYLCTECSHRFDHFQSMVSDALTECPECEGKLKRLIGAGAALIFKGSGFYCTDYKKPDPDKKVERAKEAAKQVKQAEAASSSSGGGDSSGGSGGSGDSNSNSAA